MKAPKIVREPRVGSIIQFSIPNGLRLVGGRAEQEYKDIRGRVYLTSPNLVAAVKGREGHPYVVESYKLIKW
jgi:hypothetical protein